MAAGRCRTARSLPGAEQRQQQRPVAGLAASVGADALQFRQIHTLDNSHHVTRQMRLWQPVLYRRRKKTAVVAVDHSKAAHAVDNPGSQGIPPGQDQKIRQAAGQST